MLTCTPETRAPEGLCIDTLRLPARAAVEHSSATSRERTADMALLLCTRKGLVTRRPPHAKSECAGDPVVRAGLLACELRLHRGQRQGPSRLHSGLSAKTRLQLRGSAGFAPASQFRRKSAKRANNGLARNS